jgi:sulfur carrier protein ThiS
MIKLRLSGSLRDIYKDKSEEIIMEIMQPISVRELLSRAGINPLVVTIVLVDGDVKNKDDLIDKKIKEIILMGPIAGG